MNTKLRLFFSLLWVVVIVLGIGPGRFPGYAAHTGKKQDVSFQSAGTPQLSAVGKIYQQGKYPNKHRYTVRAKALSNDQAADVAKIWTCRCLIPSYYSYYFSSFYRSYINAILNGNDPMRGPPAC